MTYRLPAIVLGSVMTAIPFAGAQLIGHLIGHDFVARADAQPAAPGPAQMQPELDNDTMLVLRIKMAPHERTPMHDLTARLVVWLTDAHLRDTSADGTTSEYRRAAGTVEWVSPRRHAGENLSDQPIEFLAIVPKPAASAPAVQHDRQH